MVFLVVRVNIRGELTQAKRLQQKQLFNYFNNLTNLAINPPKPGTIDHF